MEKENLFKIIEAGSWAPSGENSQPWRFEYKNGNLYVFNLPERDNPVYNFKQRGSLVAHGALLENIKISAVRLGYNSKINLLPDLNNPDLVSRINFKKTDLATDPLCDFIKERHTNRKPYGPQPLAADQLFALQESIKGIDEVELKIIENNKERKKIAQAVSANEIVALETKTLHKSFFKSITWNEKEEKNKKLGLYIKTLELPPPARLIFKTVSRWPMAAILNKMGFARAAAGGSAKTYSSGSAMAVFLINKKPDSNFISAGGAMQRFWLEATRQGLSVQPLAGMLFLGQRIEEGENSPFKDRHVRIIEKAYNLIKDISGAGAKTPAMLMRVGRGEQISARSMRQTPNITYVNS